MIEPPAEIRRLAFLGTPDASVPPLRALVQEGFDVGLVVSGPDRRRRRGGDPEPSPVKAAATGLGLPVVAEVDEVVGAGVDLGVVVAFGQIIKPHVLAVVPMINLHFSLLPRWRGAAPVERAILAGDEVTGVCVMAVEEGLDTGGVYQRAELAIEPDVTLEELRGQLVEVGTSLLVDTLREGLGAPTPQAGDPTYARKLTPDELRLDWSRPAAELHRVVRLGEAWTTFRRGRLKVRSARPVGGDDLKPGQVDGLRVGTATGSLELIELQPEGRGRIPARDWLNGVRVEPGERLGDPDD